MRREDTGEVVEMLRPQKRSTDRTGKQAGDGPMPQEADLSDNRADAPEETTESRRKPLNAQGGKEDRAPRAPRSRLLVGTALAVLGVGGLLGGAVAVGVKRTVSGLFMYFCHFLDGSVFRLETASL
ncbi:hypothetical protein AD936_05115, partial [Gluconobacter japonicus]